MEDETEKSNDDVQEIPVAKSINGPDETACKPDQRISKEMDGTEEADSKKRISRNVKIDIGVGVCAAVAAAAIGIFAWTQRPTTLPADVPVEQQPRMPAEP